MSQVTTESMMVARQSDDDECRPTHVKAVTSDKQSFKRSGGVLETNRGLGSKIKGDTK